MAVSTGRCNTGLEFTRRGFKAQSFSRALIQAQRYFVEFGLRIAGQVGFFREVLSQQPVSVSVGVPRCQGLWDHRDRLSPSWPP